MSRKQEFIFVYPAQSLQVNVKEIALEEVVKCENCKLFYECEYSYLGGCTNGIKWNEQEKDEE